MMAVFIGDFGSEFFCQRGEDRIRPNSMMLKMGAVSFSINKQHPIRADEKTVFGINLDAVFFQTTIQQAFVGDILNRPVSERHTVLLDKSIFYVACGRLRVLSVQLIVLNAVVRFEIDAPMFNHECPLLQLSSSVATQMIRFRALRSEPLLLPESITRAALARARI